MTKPKLVHNNSGPDRSKFSGSTKLQANVSDKASNTSISSESETGQINRERAYGDQMRLKNIESNRKDIGHQKLNKLGKESTKSVS